MSRQAQSIALHFLSDPQTKEVRNLFDFLDTDRDGLLTVQQAINLCRQLGFNVDQRSLQLGAEQHVSLRDLLGWCESFVAACAHSEDLHLTQMFMLLQRGGDGITAAELRRYLAEEKLSFREDQVELLIEAMADEAARVNVQQFKAFMRRGGVAHGPGDASDDEGSPDASATARARTLPLKLSTKGLVQARVE